ncbi:MAG: EAL domain-containing protein [Pseudomonadota bacterium]
MSHWSEHTAMVVEDSGVQRAHLVDLLRSMEFGAVLEACDGNDALRVLALHGNKPVGLVLTDIDMPGMDGIELIRCLAERRLTDNLIVTSARDPRLLEIVESMASDDARLHLLGTLIKPVRLPDLEQLMLRAGRPAVAAVPLKPSQNLQQIEQALHAGQFLPYFQPKVAMDSGAVKGAEVLARWRHPEHGMIPPDQFIPVLEGTPLMAPFTLAMVEQALGQSEAWRRAMPGFTLSLNLSADNLADSDFLNRLAEVVSAHGLPPQAIIWEVTETMVMSNLSQSLGNLARLRLKGFGLAMDDYGIGFSSMQQLSRCPFTELKVDRVFVDGAALRPNRRVILESAIEMGHKLNITLVAEGVESVADWQLLRTLGCDLAQGYLVARPMPGADMLNWIKTNRMRLKALAGALPAE